MSVKLRLQRHGAKKRPFYRIVAAESRARRDGRFLEVVGTYNPTTHPIELRLNNERVEHWLSVGAQPSDTVASLLRRAKRDPGMLAPREPARKAAPSPKVEEPTPKKIEAKKAEAPKAEAPKADEPKAEAPKADEPKAEAPKADEPKAEAPKAEAPKAE